MDFSGDGQQVERGKDSPELVGPYTLIAQIAAGDFTSVHLAQKEGALGFHRLSAIKRLKPEFAKAPEWTQLLLDEARLSGVVRHPNIVDILDVGTDAGAYIVMEYIEGADLDILIARAGKERHPRYLVPPIVDALTGLHAVHTAKDELGESLSMVHQAPRARHILIGIDGISRITDFSQVSARGLIPSTLRGKRLAVGYMAPEQVLVSEPVSARTDIFIAGITLWETLTGTQLFHAETASLSRRAITERHIQRPSEVGLRPPRCFDDVCMKALQRNPEQRYQSAEEMARELREVAMNDALYASASELGQWVRALASRALVERRRALGSNAPSQEIQLDAPGNVPSVQVSFASPVAAEAPSVAQASEGALRPVEAGAVPSVAEAPSTAAVPQNVDSSLASPRAHLDTDSSEGGQAPEIASRETATFLAQLTEPARPSEQPVASSTVPAAGSAKRSRTLDREEIVADDPSRVARSRSVPPASTRPGSRPSSPALSKATLMGVSPRPSSAPSIPPPALSATLSGTLPAGPLPGTAGYGGPARTIQVEAKQEPTAWRARGAAPANATLPEGSFLRDLNLPQPTSPASRVPSRPAAQPSYTQPAPAVGFADALAGDPHEHPPLHRASASAAYQLPNVEREPGSGAFRTPGSGLPAPEHARRSSTRFPTSDGLVPADIFARVQAARQQAGESFRPPTYSGFDELDFEEGRKPKNGFASLLLVAALLGAGFFGYRHYSNPLAPTPAADPSVSAAAQPPVDPGPVELEPAADQLAPSAAPAEPVAEVPEPVVTPVLEAAPTAVPPPVRVEEPAYVPPVPAAQPARAQAARAQAARAQAPAASRPAVKPRPAGQPSFQQTAPARAAPRPSVAGSESLPDNPY